MSLSFIYISGKIGSLPDKNIPKFQEAENFIESFEEYMAINPHKIHKGDTSNFSWSDFMKDDLQELITCDGIAMLDDWKTSPGARLELLVALKLEKKVYCAHDMNEFSKEEKQNMLMFILAEEINTETKERRNTTFSEI